VVFGTSHLRNTAEFDLSFLNGTNGFQIVAGYTDLSNFQQRFLEGGAFLDDDEYADLIHPNNHEINIIFGSKSFTKSVIVVSAVKGVATTITFDKTNTVQMVRNVGDTTGNKIDDLVVSLYKFSYLI